MTGQLATTIDSNILLMRPAEWWPACRSLITPKVMQYNSKLLNDREKSPENVRTMHGLLTDHLKKIATNNQDKIHILIQRIGAATKEKFDSKKNEQPKLQRSCRKISTACRKREEYLASLQTRTKEK